jgi:RND family efflux transporter MFP subunit
MSSLLLVGCGQLTTDVRVATAQPHDVRASTGGLGTVAAAVDLLVAFNIAGVKAPVQVEDVQVVLGSHVTVGQPLVTIDPAPLASSLQALQLNLQQAKAAQADLAARLNFAKPGQGAALQSQLQAATARVNIDQQVVNIANGQQPVITSPIAGDVAAVNVVPHQWMSPGRPIVEIVDSSQIIVTATLPVNDRALAVVGEPATLSFAGLPDVHADAKVIGVAPTATDKGLGFQVVVEGNNTPSKQVLPGLQAYVQLSSTLHAALAVPKLAISNIDQDPSVFVVRGDSVTFQAIQVGAVDNRYVQILSGLRPGDRVVTAGYQTLSNGSKVRVIGAD